MKKNIKYYVDRFIYKNPFIREGLYQGYINSTGLTLILHPYIKSKLGNDISFDAVKMTIFRNSKNIKMPDKKSLFKVKDIFIKRGINIYTIPSSEYAKKYVEKVEGKYHSSIRGETQKTFIFDDFYKDKVEKLFNINKKSDKQILSNLVIAGIKIDENLKDNLINIPGIFYLISKNLYFYGVNVIQIIQTKNEFSVVIEEKDLKDAVYAISSI